MAKIKTLIVSGANNHDWARSTPYCRDLLTKSGRFDVDVTETAGATLADAAQVARYDLFFLDYNGPDWGEAANTNFMKAVRGGAGVTVLHAADNPFVGWAEYEAMVKLLWRDGAGHGEFHEYDVEITDPDHPITRGITTFRKWDELYHRMVNTQGVAYHVIASALSATASRGTGHKEPMLLTGMHGKGRVFHDLMGHVWKGDPNGAYRGASMVAFESPEFQTTLLRGCEWAATGTVTL